jgi:hypothetical protein
MVRSGGLRYDAATDAAGKRAPGALCLLRRMYFAGASVPLWRFRLQQGVAVWLTHS